VYTLGSTPREKVACYRCAVENRDCDRCRHPPRRMHNILHASNYYASYYSDYYSDYFSQVREREEEQGIGEMFPVPRKADGGEAARDPKLKDEPRPRP
jgi:hypothetical protein